MVRCTGRSARIGMTKSRKIEKLLAANRSEIAIRIFRAANELGLRTVAVYSNEDRLALHRFKADEAYLIGKGKGPVEAYLDIAGIVAVAKSKGVDAIHPGYGFLSENAAFARACEKAGITFIGPTPELLELLGDKTAARRLAQSAGVSVLPGTEDPVKSIGEAKRVASEIGYPVIVKAAMGGGGRGMRVVREESELEARIEEAQGEAKSAFGDASVFLEKFLPRARHIEVQILADQHGNLLHLYERDCSVQRRHQKVVELAPAANLPANIRNELCGAAVDLARKAKYRNAGTVEFLYDVDAQKWYFIEVNPRIQVEHTVTEMVTGIDLVRAQILVAQGHKLHDETMSLPQQEKIPLYGAALQCRVTTEDPEKNFAPDYGKLTTYRSPAGFGIRLDGGTAYAGASLAPYYDSLLVKVTAWGTNLPEACQRMDRALREFRIRGVKTNIPFVENVVNHPKFRSGEVTTGFLEQHPELFRFPKRGDRATKLLSYLGDVILNGNPEVKGKKLPENVEAATLPRLPGIESPKGTRQLLQKLGPEKFAGWAKKEKRLLITDTTLRDAHQSLMATRVRTYDLLATATAISQRLPNLFSLEMWGGATFDTALRFLHEDPWQRLRALRERVPNICFQMLLRGANTVGYTSYPDNVIREFVKEAHAEGMDIFRVFDSLNSIENMRVSLDAVLEAGGVCEGAICYTGDILDKSRPKYSLKYYVGLAKQLEKIGVHFLAIKDMAGLCRPFAAFELVKRLKQEVDLPIHFHTHDTSGINASSILKATEAGVDIADAAVSSMSGGTSQPNLNAIVASLKNTPRDTKLDLEALNECSDYWETVRAYYAPFDSGPKAGSARLYEHEIPGGQYTNLREQAVALGLGQRWREVEKTFAEVNQLFGDIVKVTPSSKVVGDMTLFLMAKEMKPADVLKLDEHHDVSFPNSVVEMMSGVLGVPPGGWPKKLQKIILRGESPLKGRPSANLPPADFTAEKEALEKRTGHAISKEDLLSYLLYPEVFTKFDKFRQAYSDVSVLPTLAFFYGLKSGEEITVEIEAGKTLIVKFLTASEPHPDGTRTLYFELNGQSREVNVRDKALRVIERAHPKADPAEQGQVGAPTAGVITGIAVQANQSVGRGAKLMTLEAMKMQSNIYAPFAGRIVKLLVAPGQSVEAKDLLVTIAP
ncbi:MAG: pyruvate carboxylase, partial [Acidobacteria bacterium]|nr:pyruvate carboxylase [Acidobacteriota bacterium]MBS1867214.1 pyruvate carboxylase [Acidobacteriota bacterium]